MAKNKTDLFKLILDAPPNSAEKDWENLSKSAREFVHFCLEKDPKNRPSALECLEHPWLVSEP